MLDVNRLATKLEEMLAVPEIKAYSNLEGVGTKATGYALPELGPFRCGNCRHFAAPDKCNHPEVVADSDVAKSEDGKTAVVHSDSCCNEFRPIDKGEKKTSS